MAPPTIPLSERLSRRVKLNPDTLADLANRAPQTFNYLQMRVAQLKELGGL